MNKHIYMYVYMYVCMYVYRRGSRSHSGIFGDVVASRGRDLAVTAPSRVGLLGYARRTQMSLKLKFSLNPESGL